MTQSNTERSQRSLPMESVESKVSIAPTARAYNIILYTVIIYDVCPLYIYMMYVL